ncbi:MAG: ribosome biogenesis GTPase YlqF [Oscillospiraceae bacterium]|nr:ribosome biogenesis GTPase YlqF [Oscillospiraceae bacterium]
MDGQHIQWFPGHMAKTRRLISEHLRLCDGAVEIVDARVTRSGRNPEIDKLLGDKPRILLLNKADLADGDATNSRIAQLRRQGKNALAVDCRSGRGLNAFNPLAREVCAEQIARNESKGMTGRALRFMVVGIPNCGKSSFINRMAGRVKAEAADRPGVTRHTNWFAIGGGLELLDTPGVLWPKFEDQSVGQKLAFIGSVKDEILDAQELACAFLEVMRKGYPDRIRQRYCVDCEEFADEPFAAYAILEKIASKRGFLQRGKQTDTLRAARMLMDEYRSGRLGRISLD